MTRRGRRWRTAKLSRGPRSHKKTALFRAPNLFKQTSMTLRLQLAKYTYNDKNKAGINVLKDHNLSDQPKPIRIDTL